MQPFLTQEEANELADALNIQVEAECADFWESLAPYVPNPQQLEMMEVF